MSQGATLLLLFVVLPLVVAPLVVAIVVRRSPAVPAGSRTSELLRDGEPARAELIEWKNKGQLLFDSRPMVAFHLTVQSTDAPYDLFVMQSIPRSVLNKLAKGMTLDVRLAPDHTTGAIEWPTD